VPAPHLIRFLACATVLVFLPHLRADDSADRQRLLAEARDGNRKAIEAIRTISLDFDVQVIRADVVSRSDQIDLFAPAGRGLYRQSETTYRLLSTRGIDKYTSDLVARNGRAFGVSKHGVNAVWNFFSGPGPVKERLWIREYLLLSHPAPSGKDTFAFNELLGEPYTVSTVERAGDVVRVELTHPAGRLELHFSPKHNWLVRKRVWAPTMIELRYQAEVTEFAESQPGMYFPLTVEHRTSTNDETRERRRLNVASLIVNKPIPPEQFQIPDLTEMVFGGQFHDVLVPGTEPVRYSDRAFRSDANGYPIPEPKPVEMPMPTGPATLRPLPNPGMPDGSRIPPERPLAPWWVWGIVASLGVVVVSAGLEILRLRKLVRGGPPDGTVGRP
jgi:hypothetical protein